MGGNVAWTIRQADGTEYRMDRWTNIFPDVTMNDAFLGGEPEAFAAAIESWLSMKDDWERNRATGKFENNMTKVYAPYPFGLRPSEYGFIVTDFVTKTMISCQHYTTLGRFFLYPSEFREDAARCDWQTMFALFSNGSPEDRAAILHHMRQTVGQPDMDEDFLRDRLESTAESEKIRNAEDAEARNKTIAYLKKMQAEERIVSFDERVNGKFQRTPGAGLTVDEITNRALSDGVLGRLLIKPLDPWVVLDFNSDTSDGRREAFEAVQKLGLVLDETEITDFEDWIKDDPDSEE